MGKVLKKFTNGFTGAVSRSNDTIIISVKNAAGAEGTTLRLPNVTVRTVSDGGSRAEAVLTKRNIM